MSHAADHDSTRVWADVVRAAAPDLPAELAGSVDDRSGDPSRWVLTSRDDVGAVAAFLSWRRTFVHTIELGSLADVVVLEAWLSRRGQEFGLSDPQTMDFARFSSLWWSCTELKALHPALHLVVDRIGAAAAVARTEMRSVRLRHARHEWSA